MMQDGRYKLGSLCIDLLVAKHRHHRQKRRNVWLDQDSDDEEDEDEYTWDKIFGKPDKKKDKKKDKRRGRRHTWWDDSDDEDDWDWDNGDYDDGWKQKDMFGSVKPLFEKAKPYLYVARELIIDGAEAKLVP